MAFDGQLIETSSPRVGVSSLLVAVPSNNAVLNHTTEGNSNQLQAEMLAWEAERKRIKHAEDLAWARSQERLYALADIVERLRPGALNMGVWLFAPGRSRYEDMRVMRRTGFLGLSGEKKLHMRFGVNFCTGGLAVAVFSEGARHQSWDLFAEAQNILGLTYLQADRLFMSHAYSNWSSFPTRSEVAWTLRHLAETRDVFWR